MGAKTPAGARKSRDSLQNEQDKQTSQYEGYPPSYGFYRADPTPSTTGDFATDFCNAAHIEAFEQALAAPDSLLSPTISSPYDTQTASPTMYRRQSFLQDPISHIPPTLGMLSPPVVPTGPDTAAPSDLLTPTKAMFFSAKNDWAPINEKIKRPGAKTKLKLKSKPKKDKRPHALPQGHRTKDETREGVFYSLLKWPLFAGILSVLSFEWLIYLLTRFYIWWYEHFFTWRGPRNALRRRLQRATTYDEWVEGAGRLDEFLDRQKWKEDDKFAYYDSVTVRRAYSQLKKLRAIAEAAEAKGNKESLAANELAALLQSCVKNNFAGVENTRLYSQTYYGTKNLVQEFLDELSCCIDWAAKSPSLPDDRRHLLFKHLSTNYGRTALCLSGGATFSFYHFGVVKALLDANLLPDVITGTSGGAMVAALVATRTNEELNRLLIPDLANKINACNEPITTWFPRWWKTGARFDAVDWARKCQWWTRGSTTFREAYERTGRILNITCVPADPHSPTILCNYLTSPDCVIWSAVIASAAVPGILNPVVLMMKTSDGSLVPYSFGHRWKDGSLRTDIPIRALNLHFNVNFTIVSQTNPHINVFFFHSRGSVGHPVTHRKGKGWRGGYIGSAIENFLRLDMIKWLRFIRSTELLPRPLGQDWSQLWLQPFNGTITIWPKSRPYDLVRILSDPDWPILARMIHEGRQSAFPTLKFVQNRLAVERRVERGRLESRRRSGGTATSASDGTAVELMSEDEIQHVLETLHDQGSSASSEGSMDEEDHE
ncbi:Patatin-like phospholipase domain-containing protein [Ceratocystis lukuohia]|uniref:Patatin-like phospholipase domain-containing protein n=1 Tax=Ceratocystis lukuohia TaxID=2019550 RepID=A0ABR4MDT4_9PEZI